MTEWEHAKVLFGQGAGAARFVAVGVWSACVMRPANSLEAHNRVVVDELRLELDRCGWEIVDAVPEVGGGDARLPVAPAVRAGRSAVARGSTGALGGRGARTTLCAR